MKRTIADIFAILVGIFLLIEGIWGLFSSEVFWMLTTNPAHAVIHITLGIAGISMGWLMRAKGYCWFLGGLLVAVGVMRFIPGADRVVIVLFNVNEAVAYLNIAVGAAALAAAAMSKTEQAEMSKSQR